MFIHTLSCIGLVMKDEMVVVLGKAAKNEQE
jgi:hypothetical protein